MKKNLRFDSLDVLRILTTIVIVIYHAHLRSNVHFSSTFLDGWFNVAYFGVDIFFVLSGLLFEKLYGDNSFSASGLLYFLKKRVLKIYPFYAFFSALFLPVFLLSPITEVGCENRALTGILSFLMMPQACSPILSIAWTLPIQLYCYLLFGLLRSRIKLWRMVALGIFTITLLNYGRVLLFNQTLPSLPSGLNFFITPYILEFAVGILLAHLPKITWGGLWMALFFTLALIFDVHHADSERVLILGTFSAIVVNIFYHWHWQAPTWLRPRLIYLSAASYFIFLTHFQFQSVLVIAMQNSSLFWIENRYVILAISIIVSPGLGLAAYMLYSKCMKSLSYWRTTVPAPTTLPA